MLALPIDPKRTHRQYGRVEGPGEDDVRAMNKKNGGGVGGTPAEVLDRGVGGDLVAGDVVCAGGKRGERAFR